MMCRHCQDAVVSRPRRLCWSCYYRPEVRDLYPTSDAKGAYRSLHHHLCRTSPPAKPTQAPPGSPEKIEVLIDRFVDGVDLWHPDDFNATND